MTVMAGGVPTLPGLGTYPHRNAPLAPGSLGRGGMSLVNQPLPDAHSPLYSHSARSSRSESQRWSLVGTQSISTQKPDMLSAIENGKSKAKGSFIAGLYNTSPRRSKSKEEPGQLPAAFRWTSCPPRAEPEEELLGDNSARDKEPKAPLSSRRVSSSQRRRSRESAIEQKSSKESDADVRNSPDEEGSNELSIASAIAEMTRPRVIWDALNWLELRQQSLDSCKHEDVRSLMSAVHKSTQHALESSSYVSETGLRMNLKAHVRPVQVAQWFGQSNLNVTDLPAEVEGCGATVPIVVAECEPLEVVRRLKNAGMSRQINVLTEITEFDRRTGDISKQCNALCAQQSCLLQTDFSCFLTEASRQMQKGSSTIQEHLRASHDPYVCLCPEVTLFRGTRDDGYPLLDEPLSINVIFSSLPEARPLVQVSGDGAEWYADEKDQTALLERLNLIGLVALQRNATDSETLPVLVLNAFGCGGRGQHPRDAVANSLKHWRRGYGRYFHSVIVACGSDRDLALHMDRVINEQVYAVIAQSAQTSDIAKDVADLVNQQEMLELGKWHWDADILALHCRNLELQSGGRKAKDWYESVLAKQKAEEETENGKSLMVPTKRSSSKERTGDFSTRLSVQLNSCFFMSEALGDTVKQMAHSRSGTPTGSRSGSPVHELTEDGINFRQRTPSMSRQRDNSVSGNLEVDVLEDPLRRKSWGGGHNSPGPSRRSSGDDSRRPSAAPRSSLLILPGGNPGSRKNSTDVRKSSIDERRKSSVAGADILSANVPLTVGVGDTKDAAHSAPRRSGSKEHKPVDKVLEQEEIRRQARDKLRARKSEGSTQDVVQDDAKSTSTATGDGSLAQEKDEGSLLQEVQMLADTLQNRLHNKRTSYVRARHSKRTSEVVPAPEIKINSQVVESDPHGCKTMSLLIPEVPVVDAGSPTKPGKGRGSFRKVMGDVTCGNIGFD